nr:immunoglobulin heavy chain junction region [Mus musculus]NSM07057.1 immunoglobulin heavy chain junction region [Mus musculus]
CARKDYYGSSLSMDYW